MYLDQEVKIHEISLIYVIFFASKVFEIDVTQNYFSVQLYWYRE